MAVDMKDSTWLLRWQPHREGFLAGAVRQLDEIGAIDIHNVQMIATVPIGREHNGHSIWRPTGSRVVGRRFCGHDLLIRSIGVHHEDVGKTRAGRNKQEFASIRGPMGIALAGGRIERQAGQRGIVQIQQVNPQRKESAMRGER